MNEAVEIIVTNSFLHGLQLLNIMNNKKINFL